MSWIQRLYETYENCANAPQFAGDPPMPVSHTKQQAHIEIVIDGDGNFIRATIVPKEETIVPATEESAGRTRKAVPHALCDKIQYCAGDYERFGGTKDFGYPEFLSQLEQWVAADFHSKAAAVLKYVSKGSVVRDLADAGVVALRSDGMLMTEWSGEGTPPELFRLLTPDAKTKQRDQGSAFVRWRVQIQGEATSAVWDDGSLRESWMRYCDRRGGDTDVCMVTGELALVSVNHPKRLRHGADGAKLLSSNDESGFTFRGRFESSTQAYGVGSIVSQKAHSALRWLIGRQGARAGEQVFVAWAIGGAPVPDPLVDTFDLFALVSPEPHISVRSSYSGDAGQRFAMQLKSAMQGYRAALPETEKIAIIGLNSATPGRMAITFYREFGGHEFLDRIATWHSTTAWHQELSKERRFVGAPAPRDIAEIAYGRRIDDALLAATVERLLPCIIDGRALPRDLVMAAVHRSCNRSGLEDWEWRKTLGVACALYRGLERGEGYEMSLEEDRSSRDYLFGRLLAIAESIEESALHAAGEKPRETSAAKLMQRFSMHPCSTWTTIELALKPYENRLRSRWPQVLTSRRKQLDAVMGKFRPAEFVSDTPLSGEFLLGYHCQRAVLWGGGKADSSGNYEGNSPKNGAE